MKKSTICLICLLLSGSLWAQEDTLELDPVAILILDRMSEVIGELKSCSFELHTSQDMQDNTFFLPMDDLGLVKHYGKNEVYMAGPGKMLINTNNDRGHEGYWYDGDLLTYYSYDHNNFALINAPDTNILETIYTVNERYGIEFPAADFFNPYFTDDLLWQSDKVLYLGTTKIDGKDCFKIIATSKEKNVQLWISNDALTLPQKMVVVYLDEEDSPQYEASFENWQLNPDLPEALFSFMPPPDASEIAIMPLDTTLISTK